MSEDLAQTTSPHATHSAAHHRGALRVHRDGSSGDVAEVSPGTRAHPGDRRLRHPVPRGSTSPKSYSQKHCTRAVPVFQPSRHPSRNSDRSGNTVYVPADLCRLLRVKQLRTTVYHPQTDGLVERFNQTLKQMLRRVAVEDKRDWDLMLPYVLFGIREVPQASTGFIPFELLFGRQPRGLLDVAKEAWEQQQPAPQRSLIEHVAEMRQRIDRVMPLVREHLAKAQQAQQRHYDRAAQPREFQTGDRVMVLVPTAACKFLATWKGPYMVVEKIGPVTYRVRQPGRRNPEQLYHVNLLKKWVGTREQVVALATMEPGTGGC